MKGDLFFYGAMFGVLLGVGISALDRWLFSPFTERTADRAKREQYFKAAARRAALEEDTDV